MRVFFFEYNVFGFGPYFKYRRLRGTRYQFKDKYIETKLYIKHVGEYTSDGFFDRAIINQLSNRLRVWL